MFHTENGTVVQAMFWRRDRPRRVSREYPSDPGRIDGHSAKRCMPATNMTGLSAPAGPGAYAPDVLVLGVGKFARG